MARRTVEELSGKPLELVYIASNVTDAENAERTLTRWGIEYALNLEPFWMTNPFGFGTEYQGVCFYVPQALVGQCHKILESQGLTPVDRAWTEPEA